MCLPPNDPYCTQSNDNHNRCKNSTRDEFGRYTHCGNVVRLVATLERAENSSPANSQAQCGREKSESCHTEDLSRLGIMEDLRSNKRVRKEEHVQPEQAWVVAHE